MRVPSDLTPAHSRPTTPLTSVTTAHDWIPRSLTPPGLHQSSSENYSPKIPSSFPNAQDA
ncbi:hypothetical protein BCR34DRAFT_560936 [Clohesyomyces aquaticus]|uniref:Uncharacterized protein n=1 Tax=Clohesyomyces aquaticus TaxID=1231657 RepID=A0A1Y1ZVB9_9PLEO|nr:hypothetical protein BCR34DRAFT_560936 [Clohesyomyces aquaticus]